MEILRHPPLFLCPNVHQSTHFVEQLHKMMKTDEKRKRVVAKVNVPSQSSVNKEASLQSSNNETITDTKNEVQKGTSNDNKKRKRKDPEAPKFPALSAIDASVYENLNSSI